MDYAAKIKSLHKEMLVEALDSGILPEKYEEPLSILEVLDEEELIMVLGFFLTLYLDEYVKIIKIRNMVPSPLTTWDNYKALGVTGLTEQTLLSKAQTEFRKSFNASIRIYYLKKRKNANVQESKKNPVRISSQS